MIQNMRSTGRGEGSFAEDYEFSNAIADTWDERGTQCAEGSLVQTSFERDLAVATPVRHRGQYFY